MSHPTLTIAKTDDPKGRAFTVHLVAWIHCPQVIDQPSKGNTQRPVLLAYAGTPATMKAFTANLRSGEAAASTLGRRFELLRSHGYRYEIASTPAGQLAIAYLPDLLHLKPGSADANTLRFLSAPPVWWLDQQEQFLRPRHGARARDVAHALAFIARLDQRTPLPIANDPGFHLALFEAACEQDWVSSDLDTYGLEDLGLERPLLCGPNPVTFRTFLSDFTSRHLPKEALHGSSRFAGDRGVLPHTTAPGAQLCLDVRASAGT